MGDYGIRISEEGKDVATCEDRECVFTSKYSLAKGGICGIGNITDTAPAIDDPAEGTLEITHNFGYIPVVRLFMLSEGEFFEIPEVEWGAGVYVFDVSYVHTSVNKITITASLWVSGEQPTIDIDFAYFVSYEKVNI